MFCDPGFPRKVMQPGEVDGRLHIMCVCQPTAAVSKGRRLFKGCQPGASRCAAPELDADTDDYLE